MVWNGELSECSLIWFLRVLDVVLRCLFIQINEAVISEPFALIFLLLLPRDLVLIHNWEGKTQVFF